MSASTAACSSNDSDSSASELGLCAFCHSINLENLDAFTFGHRLARRKEEGFEYGPSIGHVRETRERCRFCNLMCRLWQDVVDREDVDLGLKIKLKSYGGALPGVSRIRQRYGLARKLGLRAIYPKRILGLRVMCEGKERYLRVFVDNEADILQRTLIAGRMILKADSDANFGRVGKWLNNCVQNHKICSLTISGSKVGAKEENPMPSRIVDVGLQPGENPRVVETNGQSGQYAALSYCWGGRSVVTTMTTNLHQHRGSISTHTLPKTIMDAITVCRRLGVRYLWVDSLCIVQDDPDDWIKEATTMGDIYQRAYFTIAASAAADGDEGCFIDRRTDDEEFMKQNHHVRLPCRAFGQHLGYINVALPPMFKPPAHRSLHLWSRTRDVESIVSVFIQELNESHWNHRAWVLQERFLSRRIIHYGRNQIYWECQHSTYPETGPTDNYLWDPECFWRRKALESIRYDKEGKGLFQRSVGFVLGPWQAELTRKYSTLLWPLIWKPSFDWGEIIEKYTTCHLTRESDKITAIAGLASKIANFTKYQYLAGLWLQDINRGLFWCALDDSVRKPAHPRAPTWSWAAWDGPIRAMPSNRLNQIKDMSAANPHDPIFIESDASIYPTAFPMLQLSAHVWKCQRGQVPASASKDWLVEEERLPLWELSYPAWSMSEKAFPLYNCAHPGECVGVVQFDDVENMPLGFEVVLLLLHVPAQAENGKETRRRLRRYYLLVVGETERKGVYRRMGIGVAVSFEKDFIPEHLAGRIFKKIRITLV